MSESTAVTRQITPQSALADGRAHLHIGGEANDVLAMHQQAPYRLLRPSSHGVGARLAVLANISGGLVGGDQMDCRLETSGTARAMVLSQSAEKAYRSSGPTTLMHQTYAARDQSWLEVLPRELIVFDGAKVRRTFDCQADSSAQMLIGDMSILGRTHMGEVVRSGHMQDAWSLRLDGALVYLDRQHLNFADPACLAAPAALAGHTCFGTLMYAGAQAQAFVESVRAMPVPMGVHVAASGFAQHAVARLMGSEAGVITKFYGALWGKLRHKLAQLPEDLPPIWSL